MSNLVNSAVMVVVRPGPLGPEYLVSERLRGSQKGRILFPGGKCEPGETARECAKRELMEEAGLIALSMKALGWRSFFQTDDGRDTISMVFLVTIYWGEPQRLEPDISGEWQWMTLDQMEARCDCDIARRVIDMVAERLC